MDRHFPGFSDKVSFIFDRCDDKDWIVPIHKVHCDFSAKDPRIGGLAFEDDKEVLPLQAADLLAYSFHQNATRYINDGEKITNPLRSLDLILNRNLEPKFRKLSNPAWRVTVDCIREDEKKYMKDNRGKYYPTEHFKVKDYASRYRRKTRL